MFPMPCVLHQMFSRDLFRLLKGWVTINLGSTLVNGICTANTPTFVYETILLPIILLIVALQ